MAEQGEKKKRNRNSIVLIFIFLIISIVIILIGARYSWIMPKEVEVTRYVNLDNQYNKPIIMIINDTNSYSRPPYRFNLNTNEKIENKEIDTRIGTKNPYFAICIEVYENSSIENENSLLDSKEYIMELDNKNEQIQDNEHIDLLYYIKILPNGIINFNLIATREFKWSEK